MDHVEHAGDYSGARLFASQMTSSSLSGRLKVSSLPLFLSNFWIVLCLFLNGCSELFNLKGIYFFISYGL